MKDAHPLLAREGWVHCAVAVLAAVIVQWLAGFPWSLPLWLLAAFVIQFFRDPVPTIPGDVGAVVAPAHGKVVSIARGEDPYLQRPSVCVGIFMNVFSIHSNRAPVGGRIEGRWYHPGRFLNAELDKASRENERNALWIRTAEGEDVVCVQIAGLVARRILCDVERGDELARGQRFGFIRFGSRVDVHLPEDSEIRARLGGWVRPGSDIIAILPVRENRS